LAEISNKVKEFLNIKRMPEKDEGIFICRCDAWDPPWIGFDYKTSEPHGTLAKKELRINRMTARNNMKELQKYNPYTWFMVSIHNNSYLTEKYLDYYDNETVRDIINWSEAALAARLSPDKLYGEPLDGSVLSIEGGKLTWKSFEGQWFSPSWLDNIHRDVIVKGAFKPNQEPIEGKLKSVTVDGKIYPIKGMSSGSSDLTSINISIGLDGSIKTEGDTK
jgi:hypothetical protein